MDNHSKEVRSFNMSRIRSKNTKPEEIVRKFLFSSGFRYRKNDQRLPGCPDIVLKKYKAVLFVNGCFWHGHTGCRYFTWPKSNTEYWQHKIGGNIERDKQTYTSLRASGWNVIIIWECQLKKEKRDSTLLTLLEELTGSPDAGGGEVEQRELDS